MAVPHKIQADYAAEIEAVRSKLPLKDILVHIECVYLPVTDTIVSLTTNLPFRAPPGVTPGKIIFPPARSIRHLSSHPLGPSLLSISEPVPPLPPGLARTVSGPQTVVTTTATGIRTNEPVSVIVPPKPAKKKKFAGLKKLFKWGGRSKK